MDHLEAGRYWEANAEVWTRLSRLGCDTCRDYVNTPAFLANLPDVTGLRGLDIGCGEGTNTRQVAARGARMTALDFSPTFLSHAAATERDDARGICYLRATAAELPFADATFDFATSFMCFMDVPETDRLLAEAYRVIRPGGFLQFSITHPCFDLPHRRKLRDEQGRIRAYELGGYFTPPEGEVLEWIFSAATPEQREGQRRFRTPVFRHTLSEWLNLIVEAGFHLERTWEPTADEAVIRQVPNLDDMQVIGFFIGFRCRR